MVADIEQRRPERGSRVGDRRDFPFRVVLARVGLDPDDGVYRHVAAGRPGAVPGELSEDAEEPREVRRRPSSAVGFASPCVATAFSAASESVRFVTGRRITSGVPGIEPPVVLPRRGLVAAAPLVPVGLEREGRAAEVGILQRIVVGEQHFELGVQLADAVNRLAPRFLLRQLFDLVGLGPLPLVGPGRLGVHVFRQRLPGERLPAGRGTGSTPSPRGSLRGRGSAVPRGSAEGSARSAGGPSPPSRCRG